MNSTGGGMCHRLCQAIKAVGDINSKRGCLFPDHLGANQSAKFECTSGQG
jgi:hypothetical protein